MEVKLTKNTIRWYEHVLKMYKDRIPKKGFENESKTKMLKRETKIKIETTG
jgi:hypothetical protein